MPSTHPHRRAISVIAGGLALFALGAGLAACGNQSSGTSAATIPSYTIVAKDFSFDIPKGIHAGLNDIKLQNQGKEPHQAQLARLNDGVTMDQFMGAIQKGGPDAALPLVTLAGGANTIDAGKQQEVVLDLKAGQYVMLCFVSGADGMPHAAKGMMVPFTVDATSAGDKPAAPAADTEVTLQDFSFAMPSTIKAGDHTFKVTNKGPQPHEMTLLKLAPGKTMQDAMAFNGQGQPPFADVGGMGALAPNSSGWVKLHLDPGTYMAVCFVPDPASGKAHAEMGMMNQFTVE